MAGVVCVLSPVFGLGPPFHIVPVFLLGLVSLPLCSHLLFVVGEDESSSSFSFCVFIVVALLVCVGQKGGGGGVWCVLCLALVPCSLFPVLFLPLPFPLPFPLPSFCCGVRGSARAA